MNTSQGRLYYATGIDNSQLRADAAESRNILHSIGQTAMQEGANIDGAFSKIAKASAGIFATGKMAEFAKHIISIRGEVESLEISFETLAGKQKGQDLFKEIRQFAVSTPMMVKDLAQGAQTMLAFNIETEKVMPMLRAIGDISMGDAQKFNSLALAFSQASASGKLMTQDCMQMINAGFNPLSVISEKTGKTIGELKEEMEKGNITVKMMEDAFISATSEGGKFNNMLEKQSHGINGAISNLLGAVDDALNSIGEASQGPITGALTITTDLVKNYETLAEMLAALVGMYGAYHAALIVEEALANASTATHANFIAVLEAETAAVAAETTQTKLAADSEIAEAVAKGTLTEAEGLHLLSMRQEAAARVESLALAAKQAVVEAESATSARLLAMEKLKAAEISVNAMRMEYEAALAKEEVFKIAVARQRLETAQTNLNTASQEYQAAATAEATAAKAAQTAQTNANSAAQQLNALTIGTDTTATTLNAKATTALSLAKSKLIGIVKSLYAAISAHPYAIAAAAVIALAYGIYKLATYQTEAEKSTRRLEEAHAACSSQISAEKIKIQELFDKLRAAKEGTQEYKNAKDTIIKQYGSYLSGLNAEISSLKDVEGAYNAVTDAVMKSIRARSMYEYIESEGKEYQERDQKIYDKILQLVKDKKGEKFAKAHMQDIRNIMDGDKKVNQDFLKQFDELQTIYTAPNMPSRIDTVNPLKNALEDAAQNNKAYRQTIQEAEARFGVKFNEEKESTGDEPAKTNYKKDSEAKRKELKEAEAELKRLKESVSSETSQVKEQKAKVDRLKKELKEEYDINVDTESKAGAKGASVASSNTDNLANEAANRRKQQEEYAKQMADLARDEEFEISQAKIEGMKEGIEKELAQNQLNYDRLKEQRERSLRDMLDNLANERIRELENDNPTLFKKKNKDGKLEEAPGLRDEKYREIRASLTIADLGQDQQARIEELGKLAAENFAKANRDSMDKMLQDVLTYEQQRSKIAEEYARKRADLHEKNADGKTKTDADGNPIFKKGATQGNLDELNRQETEALKAVDELFAQREETYQAWCEKISDLSLRQLEAVLEDAKKRLEELEKSGSTDQKALAQARAKVNTAETAVKKAKAKDEVNPGKRSIKEWEDLYKTLNEVEKEFESIGDTVGGVVGDIISECGQFATSTLQMINGIVQLTKTSEIGIKGTAVAGATAISTMEKASVILTIISAAMQIAMQIVNLFNTDDKKQEEIENLQERIDQLQWELEHQDTGRLQAQYGTAIERLNKALIETRLELAAGATGWERFVRLSRRASSDTELMQKTAEKLAKAYGEMSYTADKALGSEKYRQAGDQLKNIAQQQILMQEQISAEASKKKSDAGAIQEWKNKIEELGQQALEIINDMVEDIIGDTSTGIAESLADAFFDAFEAGEDAARAWGDKVNEIVADVLKRMMISKFLEEPLGEIFDKYKAKWFPNGTFDENGLDLIMSSMTDFADDLNAQLTVFQEAMDALPSSLTDILKNGSSTSQQATYGGYETMSEDTGQELNGRFTAIQISVEAINESIRQMKEEGSSARMQAAEQLETLKEIRDYMPTVTNSLIDISRNTSELHDMKDLLYKIEKNTKELW